MKIRIFRPRTGVKNSKWLLAIEIAKMVRDGRPSMGLQKAFGKARPCIGGSET